MQGLGSMSHFPQNMASMIILHISILAIRLTLVSGLLARPDAIHWGPMEAYKYQDKTYVRLYMTVYDKTAGAQYKDILQDDNGHVGTRVPVGLLWVSFGDFRRQIDFAMKYKRDGEIKGLNNLPLIRSFLVEADPVLDIIRNSVSEEVAGSGKDLNVDQTKGYNQFGLTATSVEILRQFALSNSLVTFCSDSSYTGDTKGWGLVVPMDDLVNTVRQGFIYPDVEDPYTLSIILEGNKAEFASIRQTEDSVARIGHILQVYGKTTKSADEKKELDAFYLSYVSVTGDKAADKTHVFEVLLPRCLDYGRWRIDMRDQWAKIQDGGQREPGHQFLVPVPDIKEDVRFRGTEVAPWIEETNAFRVVLKRREKYIAAVQEMTSIYRSECPRVANNNKDELNGFISALTSVEVFVDGVDGSDRKEIGDLVQDLEKFVQRLKPAVDEYCPKTHCNRLNEAVLNNLNIADMTPVVVTVRNDLLDRGDDGAGQLLPLLLGTTPLTINLDSSICLTTRVDDIMNYVKKSFIGSKIGDVKLEFPEGLPDMDKLRVMDELTLALSLRRSSGKTYFQRSLPIDGRVRTSCSKDLMCEYRPDLRYVQVNRPDHLWFSTLILFTKGELYEENAIQILDTATKKTTLQYITKFKSLNDQRRLIRNALNTATQDMFTGVHVIPGVVIAPRDGKAKVVIDNDQVPSDIPSSDRARRVESLVEGADRMGSVDQEKDAERAEIVCDGANREASVGESAERSESVSERAGRDQAIAGRAERSESASDRAGRSQTPDNSNVRRRSWIRRLLCCGSGGS